jgi:hypothetical protein
MESHRLYRVAVKGHTMRLLLIVIASLILIPAIYSQSSTGPLRFKAKIGFDNPEEKILDRKIFDNNRKLLLVGKKQVQAWDVATATLLYSRANEMKTRNDESLYLSPDQRTLISSRYEGLWFFWPH